MNKPVAAPHQSFLTIGSEVPLVKKSSFPPGEAKRRLRELVPFNVPLCSGNGRLLRVPIIYKLFTHAIVVPKIQQRSQGGFAAYGNPGFLKKQEAGAISMVLWEFYQLRFSLRLVR